MTEQTPALLQHLEQDHQHIARVLAVLEAELAKYDDDSSEPDLDLVMSVIDYISAYPDAIHHPLEDLLFEKLLNDNRLSEEDRALIRLNVAEHRDIIAATQTLAADIQRIFNDEVIPIERLKQDLKDYVQTQFVHMRREQEQLFPLARSHLTDAQWQALEDQSPAANDPLFGQLEDQYESLLRYITK